MTIKMIVTDLDGTLLRKDKTISEYTLSVFRKCYEKGLKIVFATARPERATNHLFTDIPVSSVLANNGATVVSNGKVIHNIIIPKNIVEELVPTILSNNYITGITIEVGEFLFTNDAEHHRWSQGMSWKPVITDFSSPINGDVVKIAVECEYIDIISEMLSCYPHLHMLPNYGEKWIQIMDIKSSKLNAVSFLCQQNGLELENVVSFGDDYNDIEMIKNCGIGVAMGNAIDEVKAVANFICDTNDNDGVARWLENFISEVR